MIYGFAKAIRRRQVRISSVARARGTTIYLFLPRHSEQEEAADTSARFLIGSPRRS